VHLSEAARVLALAPWVEDLSADHCGHGGRSSVNSRPDPSFQSNSEKMRQRTR